jgi:hypothetical protein
MPRQGQWPLELVNEGAKRSNADTAMASELTDRAWAIIELLETAAAL